MAFWCGVRASCWKWKSSVSWCWNRTASSLACLAVAQDYRGRGFGERILAEAEKTGRKAGFKRLFVLTTRTEHWFEERGFVDSSPDKLPKSKQALYNYKRKSKVLEKPLQA